MLFLDLPEDVLRDVLALHETHGLAVCKCLNLIAYAVIESLHGPNTRLYLESLRASVQVPHIFRRYCLRRTLPEVLRPPLFATRQCGATTGVGTRCKRRASQVLNIGFCTQHHASAMKRYRTFCDG